MAAWEEINRAGPAGMLQLLPPTGGRGVVRERAPRTRTPGGYTITLAAWVHICAATRACKSTFQVWPDAGGAPQQVHEPGAVPPRSRAFNGTAKTGVGQSWTVPVRDSRKAKNQKTRAKIRGFEGPRRF